MLTYCDRNSHPLPTGNVIPALVSISYLCRGSWGQSNTCSANLGASGSAQAWLSSTWGGSAAALALPAFGHEGKPVVFGAVNLGSSDLLPPALRDKLGGIPAGV